MFKHRRCDLKSARQCPKITNHRRKWFIFVHDILSCFRTSLILWSMFLWCDDTTWSRFEFVEKFFGCTLSTLSRLLTDRLEKTTNWIQLWRDHISMQIIIYFVVFSHRFMINDLLRNRALVLLIAQFFL